MNNTTTQYLNSWHFSVFAILTVYQRWYCSPFYGVLGILYEVAGVAPTLNLDSEASREMFSVMFYSLLIARHGRVYFRLPL